MRRALPVLRAASAPLGRRALSAAAPRLPYEGVRIIEKANLLSGRLAGLMFADQGAEVLVIDPSEGEDVDSYLNRSKIAIKESDVTPSSADIIIVDGEDSSIPRLPHQIMMRTVAALPGDEKFGHLPHDVDEDYLSALTGFFTDMDMMGWLDRPVTYTPLKLCSIYAGVIGANACAAALVDRLRCGQGREIHASRIAGGLSAIGALCLKQTGLVRRRRRRASSSSPSSHTCGSVRSPARPARSSDAAATPQPGAGHLQALGRHPGQAQGHRGGGARQVQGGRDRRPRQAGVALPAAVPVHGAVQVQGRRVHPTDGHLQPAARDRLLQVSGL